MEIVDSQTHVDEFGLWLNLVALLNINPDNNK
ncbi:hypothetical protein Desca_0506 [Desulfotomaculum nigrificans CO-1-SRB]|uniref:Uncharacterized protein n=1 Tax=Desulfotomaculum nigrificans (strain DSM 14880 / VKM B-2319 / CO-1-SRB) TaxID=868595 RepID=F6B7E8_DESCC|nr:hypothetical protein Desca_0506 [Desulfotomaculum nigrificans CO-1-SRB]